MKIKTKYKQTKIRDLVEQTVGGTWGPESDETKGIPVLRSTNFTKDQKIVFENIAYRDITEAKLTNRILKNGDILIEISGGGPSQPVGRALEFINPDGKAYTYGNFVRRLKLNSDLLTQEYLSLALKALYIFGETEPIQTNTTNLRNLNFNDYINLEIPVPTIQEQKQIVSKIKECFTLLDKSEAKLKQAEKKLQVTILSARLKAFISDNTTYKQIGELAEVITKGSTPTSYGYPYIESGINFIKVESIEDQMINQARINCFISEEANNFLSRSKLREDDILFSIAGTIGKVAIVEKNILPANTNQALAIIRGYKKYFKPKYLYYFLQSAAIEELKQKARGGAMNNISLNDIKSFNIPITDFKTQERVIQYLEKTESVIKKSLKSIFIKSDQIQTLRQSILKKAFEGKLI